MATIADIEGIGAAYAAKLRKAGVRSTGELLKKGGSKKGRKELADATGFNTKTILEWVNRADLFRVKGIGAQYSDLLEAAGVDTVLELAGRKPEALLEALAKANARHNKVNVLPGLSRVKEWVKSAKSLKRAVEY
jgi:predicted flap endonuclease-1-like 5' DNA nuclease